MQHLVICLMQQPMFLSCIFLMLFSYYLPIPPCDALLVVLISLYFFLFSSLHFSFLFIKSTKSTLMCFSTVILNCNSSLTLTSHFLSFRITYWVFSHIIRKQVLQFPSLYTQHSHDFIYLDQGFCEFFPR